MCVLVIPSLALVEKEVSYTGLVKNSIQADQPQHWGFHPGTCDSLCSGAGTLWLYPGGAGAQGTEVGMLET